MSSMKMGMIFNKDTVTVRGTSSSVPRVIQVSNVPVVHSQSASMKQVGTKSMKTLFNLGGIMHAATNCTPCKACGA
jgi:hypothetical protein